MILNILGGAAVYSLSKDNLNVLNIKTKNDSELKKGTIWANPLNREIEIDLSGMYEQKFPVVTEQLYGKKTKLTYSLSNLESDKTFTLYFNFNLTGGDYGIFSPYNICHIEIKKKFVKVIMENILLKKVKNKYMFRISKNTD